MNEDCHMNLRSLASALTLACCASPFCSAQTANPQITTQTIAQTAPQRTTQPSKRQPPKPATDQAPGAAPNKVWVNATTKIYHCPGDRYYGRTKGGSYMTEADAKSIHAHGAHNQTCFK